MSPRLRARVFLTAAAALAAVLVAAAWRLPPSGAFAGAYGLLLNRVATVERHATDVVAAVNFDYRGIDTFGEEFILFASVAGVVLLLRVQPGEREGQGGADEEGEEPKRKVPPTSNAVRLLGLQLVAACVVFGLYVISHGQVTPGGGFQGGVVLATAPLLAYLAGGADVFKRIAPESFVAIGEALGAAAFGVIGLFGLVCGKTFLENVLPLGHWGSIDSAGTITLLNLATGLEVAGGFVVILTAFLSELLKAPSEGRGPKEGGRKGKTS